MKVGLVGCGKMGGALLASWLDNPAVEKIFVLDPHAPPAETQPLKVFRYKNPEDFNAAAQNVETIVLAVKPQVFDAALSSLKIPANALIISIAAGKKLASFEGSNPAARVMPNTPAAVGQGMSVAILNKKAAARKKTIETLFEKSGPVEWVENEEILDMAAGLSASGPAYVFLLIEILAKAGENLGLEPAFAMRLARQTVIGSAALAAHDKDAEAAQLRKNVTSPGGITEAALKILMNGDVQKRFDEALKAATKRGEELSSSGS